MANPDNMANPNKIAGYQSLVNIFDGEIFSNVDYFLNNIKEIGEIAQWNDAELIAVLKSKLKGPALQFFIDDPELISDKQFDSIQNKFKKYFEKKTTLSHRQQQFSNCKQNPGESVRSFSTRVSNLTVNYFGLQNVSKPNAGPIVDQTKLAKFLEGLEPNLKRLALTRNPATFDEAVESALLDEVNSQFTNTEYVHTCSAKLESNPHEEKLLDSKLSQVLEKQLQISNGMIGTLSSQINKLSSKISSNQSRNNIFNERKFNKRQPCIHCGRTNHVSSHCFTLRRFGNRNQNYRQSQNSYTQQPFHNSHYSFQASRNARGNLRQTNNNNTSYPIRGRTYRDPNQQTTPKARMPLN